MSQERRDLIRICEMLNISPTSNHEEWSNSKTDIELLRIIVVKLRLLSNDKQNLLSNLPISLAINEKNIDKLEDFQEFWNELEKFNNLLKQDHTCQRQMLLNRLDCTVESFKWKATDKKARESLDSQYSQRDPLNDKIHEKYDPTRIKLNPEPDVSISHLLAARETDCDKILNSVISSKSIDCKVAYKNNQPKQFNKDTSKEQLVNLKQIIIPEVPDRGGRVGEIPAPPRETFSQQRRNFNRGGRRY